MLSDIPAVRPRWALGLLVLLVGVGCVGPGQGATPASSNEGRTAKKTLVAVMNDEPKKLGPIGPGGGSLQSSASMPFLYESYLLVIDGEGQPRLRLASDVPTVANGGWRILPDGRMETTWTVRNDAFWHDGTPLTAKDLAFTWEVWRHPESEVGREVLNLYIDRVDVPDPHTITYHWKATFAFVQQVGRRSIVPKHLLGAAFEGDRELFNNHRYNTTEYVGLGPYRLKGWVPGSHLEFEAFDQYFLGRAKIQTLVAQFVTDPNVLVTRLLSGHADMNIPWGATADTVVPVEQRWRETREGRVLVYPGPSLRFTTHQHRDEYQKLPALKQVTVRQALAHALDKEALVDVLYGDRLLLADSWYALADARRNRFADVISGYPYDARRASQLLESQGWRPGGDGILVNQAGERFETSLTGTSEAGDAIAAIAAYWRLAGAAVQEEPLTPAQTPDREYRTKFPGMEYTAHVPIRSFLGGRIPIHQIPSQENRWSGSNRNGLSDPDLNRLMASFDATIDDGERAQVERDLLRISTANVYFGFLFFYPHQWMVRSHVTGVIPSSVASSIDDWPRVTWNAHEWDVS